MEFIGAAIITIILTILVAVIIFLPFYGLYRLLHALFLFEVFKRVRVLWFSNLTAADIEFLEATFPFYKNLPAELRPRFESRTAYLIRKKKISGKQELDVTHEMKLLVMAHATQLTFGLRPLQLSHFDRVFLMPDKYLSKHTQQYHAGQVSETGFIVLSWKHVLLGLKEPKDGKNVALHEMAHAVFVENDDYFNDEEYSFLSSAALRKWTILAQREFEHMSAGGKVFLRQYAYSNKDEFFAVAVEAFFEQSVEFHAHSPELYAAMVRLLKQDPRKSNVLEC